MVTKKRVTERFVTSERGEMRRYKDEEAWRKAKTKRQQRDNRRASRVTNRPKPTSLPPEEGE